MASVNRIITVILYVVLDISDIRNMIKGHWNWNYVSSIISLSDIRKYPHLSWDRHSLSYNPTLTFDVVKLDLPNAKGKMGLETDKSTTSTI